MSPFRVWWHCTVNLLLFCPQHQHCVWHVGAVREDFCSCGYGDPDGSLRRKLQRRRVMRRYGR